MLQECYNGISENKITCCRHTFRWNTLFVFQFDFMIIEFGKIFLVRPLLYFIQSDGNTETPPIQYHVSLLILPKMSKLLIRNWMDSYSIAVCRIASFHGSPLFSPFFFSSCAIIFIDVWRCLSMSFSFSPEPLAVLSSSPWQVLHMLVLYLPLKRFVANFPAVVVWQSLGGGWRRGLAICTAYFSTWYLSLYRLKQIRKKSVLLA